MRKKQKNIAILCTLDAFANAIRPMELKKALEANGHTVTLISQGKIVAGPTPPTVQHSNKIFSYITTRLTKIFDSVVNGKLYHYYFLLKLKKNAHHVIPLLEKSMFDVIIIENHLQAYVMKEVKNVPYILDFDAPLIDELMYSGKINQDSYKELTRIFTQIYKNATYINFQWHTYSNYIKENVYNGDNFVEVNFGCIPKAQTLRAKYSAKPKIICLGYLAGKWVNLPLLSRLSKLYDIDVYGGPVPDKKWELNYRGYAPSTNVLKEYQFGLITISQDKLRQSSFSSKHLEYLSFGLPVLTPDWRKDSILEDVSIYYNESNFLSQIEHYSQKKRWKDMSERSYQKAQILSWDTVLRPLVRLVNEL